MKVGFLGGAFNPPHRAHVLLGEKALSYYALDRLVYIPTHIPPHKKIVDGWDDQIRLLLISLAIFAWKTEKVGGYIKRFSFPEEETAQFLNLYDSLYSKYHKDFIEVSDYEITSYGVSYTINTVKYFLGKNPDWKIHIIIGMDQAAVLDTWKDYDELSRVAKFCVAERDGFDPDMIKNKFPFIDIFPFPSINISSSQIRRLLHEGKDIREMVPDIIVAFIDLLKSYQKNN